MENNYDYKRQMRYKDVLVWIVVRLIVVNMKIKKKKKTFSHSQVSFIIGNK